MQKTERVLLAGSGTLGSVSPLLAIAHAMPEAQFLLVGTTHGPEREFALRHSIPFRSVPESKFRRYFSLKNVVDIIKLPYAILASFFIIKDFQPHVVVSCGGFIAVPVSIAAWIARVPIAIHQQDIATSLTNRILSPIANLITVAFPEQQSAFPAKKTVITGNPCRLRNVQHAPEDSILILGGSSGARGLNESMSAIIPDLAKTHRVVHVLGTSNYDQRLAPFGNYEAKKFLTDDFADELARAILVVSRAGMSTLTELAHARKAVVLLPLPGSHQQTNAEFFEKKGAAITIDESDRNSLTSSIYELLNDDRTRQTMGQLLRGLFPKNAARNVADEIRSLIRTRSTARRHAHLIGIGGIGISAMVPLLEAKGYTVSGSDLTKNEVTQRLEDRGIYISYGHHRQNLPSRTSLVLYSPAIPDSNPELAEARERTITTLSYKDYLGELSREYSTIAVTGTHGKTTTTALTGLVLADTSCDPTVIVGSFVPQLGGSNVRKGASRYLVVEADEYRASMLKLSPHMIVLTNVDADHLDFYKDRTDVLAHFRQFASQLPVDGLLITNFDDPLARSLHGPKTVTYGSDENATIRYASRRVDSGSQSFRVFAENEDLGIFSLRIPGRFNVMNALAAICVARELEIPLEHIRARIGEYRGSWRRAELIGAFRGCPVYSDYGHHPTEIRATLKSFREFHPKKRLVVVYQPHSLDRTKKLSIDFERSFADADVLILCEIYDVAGRDSDELISSRDLLAGMQHPHAYFAEDMKTAREILSREVTSGDVIIIMGAGSIDKLARAIVKT